MECNKKLGLKEMREVLDWIGLAEDTNKWPAVVNTLMNMRAVSCVAE
jgi:hypothetical protein